MSRTLLGVGPQNKDGRELSRNYRFLWLKVSYMQLQGAYLERKRTSNWLLYNASQAIL